ncbi:MAG TPA: DnaJ domain-containing protein [Bauldia sp.]|nr:DnaJ domain-containing protein [Bauldia sp.]
MAWFVGGAAILFIVVALAHAFAAADPRALVRAIRYSVGVALIAVGGLLVFAERWGLALPLIAAGFSALTVGRIGPIDLGGSRRSAGTGSTVPAAMLEMHLDHDTGTMRGRVIAGDLAGRDLDDLDREALMRLHTGLGADAESRALLEAYLDRRLPGWREDVEGDAAAGPGGAADAGPMTDQQAYEVLGLAAGATEAEIRAAHRRLMKSVHPDQGGSTYLAAKINEAKDRLLGRGRHR